MRPRENGIIGLDLKGKLSRLLEGKPSTEVFPHAERELAAALGIAHDVLKEVRVQRLARATDWELVAGIVRYSAAGRAKALAALKIAEVPPAPPEAVTPAPGEKNASARPAAGADSAANDGPPARGAVRELVCLGTVRNRRVIRARDGAREVWVRVKDSKNFRPKLRLPARHLGDDRWELVGRCPRYPGKF
jgi:hypothetical protein